MSRVSKKLFFEFFNSIPKSVPFNPQWNNGTGYFDGIKDDPIIAALPTGIYTSKTNSPNDRSLIIFQTSDARPFVIAERYSPDTDSQFIVTATTCSYIFMDYEVANQFLLNYNREEIIEFLQQGSAKVQSVITYLSKSLVC